MRGQVRTITRSFLAAERVCQGGPVLGTCRRNVAQDLGVDACGSSRA